MPPEAAPALPTSLSSEQQADAAATATSVLAAAADAASCCHHPASRIVSAGMSVVVTRGSTTHSRASLAAAETATAAQAAHELRLIEQELLAEIEAIIRRADAPQPGDEQALRELHAMLTKARAHVDGPLALAKAQAATRLAAAQTLSLPDPVGNTPSPRSADEAELQRRLMVLRVGTVCRAWRAHYRRAARARRAVERVRCARLRSAWLSLRDGTRMLTAQRQEEAHRAAVAQLQSRMTEQETAERAARSELLIKLAAAEAAVHAAAAERQAAEEDSAIGLADYRSSPVVLAVSADEASSGVVTPRKDFGSGWNEAMQLDHSAPRCVTPEQPARTLSAPQSVSTFSGQSRMPHADEIAASSQVALGMIELKGYRIREPDACFARPYLIYEFQVSVGSEVWQGEKRFTDFQQLHDVVSAILSSKPLQLDGCADSNVLVTRNISLPPKRWVGNLTDEVGEERVQILQHYLAQLGHLASPAAAESREIPAEVSHSIRAALVSFVKDRHEVTAAEFVAAAAASYFEKVEKLREAFAKCDTAGTGRLTKQDLERFLRDNSVKLAGSEGRDAVADELRELREAGKMHMLKQTLAAEGLSDVGSSGLTLDEVESWWSQHCLRTQPGPSNVAAALG
jgi:hypothetical protein